ncbi:MAG: hypothetical protein ACD_49C00074G0012 [uncultured bacterium (gcode 4)]|uniref:Uncharacterized protein n=1 Tax=uncultured bacterium (gcode 4) TaxID=1234023 RepID=K2AD25_9BACT|nr:MAG: hypothetical protein ACD_49C00074G0012 [uncultured bacterium (gcode 4)]
MNNAINSINVDNLRAWESPRLVLKRHWIVFIYTFFYIFFLVFSSFALLFFFESISFIIPGSIIYLLLVMYLSIFSIFIYINWINNELDLFIITNKRIIWIEQLSFLNRTVSECSLEDVQEVNGLTKWLLANLMNFGTITIHTASEKSDFNMNIVPEPLENSRNILNIIEECRATNKIEFAKIEKNIHNSN